MNLRHLGPKPSALPTALHPDYFIHNICSQSALLARLRAYQFAPHLVLCCERVYYSRYLCESQALYKVFLELGEKHCLSPSLLFFSFGFFDFIGIKDAQGNDRTIVTRLSLGAPAANLINDFLGGERGNSR